jgi:hypothetical protein
MKKLLVFLIIAISFSCSQIAYSQGVQLNSNDWGTSMGKYPINPIKYDTVQAILLISDCDTCNAKSSFGYIIKKGEYGMIGGNGTNTLSISMGYVFYPFDYLNRDKKPFNKPSIVWEGKEKKSN